MVEQGRYGSSRMNESRNDARSSRRPSYGSNQDSPYDSWQPDFSPNAQQRRSAAGYSATAQRQNIASGPNREPSASRASYNRAAQSAQSGHSSSSRSGQNGSSTRAARVARDVRVNDAYEQGTSFGNRMPASERTRTGSATPTRERAQQHEFAMQRPVFQNSKEFKQSSGLNAGGSRLGGSSGIGSNGSGASKGKANLFLVIALVLVLAALAVFATRALGCSNAASDGVAPVEETPVPEPIVPDTRSVDFAVQPGNAPGSNTTNGEKIFYLTIDDGPSVLTPQVLDILDAYNVKATFFVTGHDTSRVHLIAEAHKRGHTIGLHTYCHDYANIYSSDSAYMNDLNLVGQLVQEQIGYVPCFIRFPGGSSNAISKSYSSGIMSRLAVTVQELGYQYYDWNISSGDGSPHTTEEILDYSLGHDGYTNIVFLCHDSATKQTTVDALPTIIEYYQELGYEFRALDRDSFTAHHGISN